MYKAEDIDASGVFPLVTRSPDFKAHEVISSTVRGCRALRSTSCAAAKYPPDFQRGL